MKILIDIGHPAHVHYFRNFISIMRSKGHEFLIIARDKEVVLYLLDYYNLQYVSRGKGRKGLLGKFFYIPVADILILRESIQFKPDIFLSFGSPYAAHVSWILGKPHIAFDDTEHAFFEHLLYVPFTKVILTPKNFRKNFGSKHFFFNGTMDLCYLQSKYFYPDKTILDYLKISEGEDYVLMRFVSWEASHDKGQKGITLENRILAVKTISKYCKVFISSESKLPEELQQYQIKVPYEKMHDVLFFAKLFFGESGTMASEACILGTPAINIATSAELVGVFDDFISSNLMYVIPDNKKAINKAEELLQSTVLKRDSRRIANEFISSRVDVTELMVWLIEQFPESVKTLKQNNDFQYTFLNKL